LSAVSHASDRGVRVGEVGFVSYLHQLRRLGVIDQSEVISWLGLHGAVIRATEAPLDDGERLDEDALESLTEIEILLEAQVRGERGDLGPASGLLGVPVRERVAEGLHHHPCTNDRVPARAELSAMQPPVS
jgi:hypothetical protein